MCGATAPPEISLSRRGCRSERRSRRRAAAADVAEEARELLPDLCASAVRADAVLVLQEPLPEDLEVVSARLADQIVRRHDPPSRWWTTYPGGYYTRGTSLEQTLRGQSKLDTQPPPSGAAGFGREGDSMKTKTLGIVIVVAVVAVAAVLVLTARDSSSSGATRLPPRLAAAGHRAGRVQGRRLRRQAARRQHVRLLVPALQRGGARPRRLREGQPRRPGGGHRLRGHAGRRRGLHGPVRPHVSARRRRRQPGRRSSASPRTRRRSSTTRRARRWTAS